MPFRGAALFLAAEPLGSGADEKGRESEACESPSDFPLLPRLEEGRLEFPSRVTPSLPGAARSLGARSGSDSRQSAPLTGFHAKERASWLPKESFGG